MSGVAQVERAIAPGLSLAFQESGAGGPPESLLLLPAGRVAYTDGRADMELRDAAAVLETSPKEILIDFDHASATRTQAAPAAGWATLEERDGAIIGNVSWTPDGEQALRTKRYRYLSPEVNYRKKTREIVSIEAAALVNRPGHLAQAERALAAAAAADLVTALAYRFGLGDDAGAAEIAAHLDDERKADALELGLAEDTSAAEIAAAKTALEAAGVGPEAAASRMVDEAVAVGIFTPAQRGAALELARAKPSAFKRLAGGDGRFAYLFDELTPNRHPGGDSHAEAEVAAAFNRPVEALREARKQLHQETER